MNEILFIKQVATLPCFNLPKGEGCQKKMHGASNCAEDQQHCHGEVDPELANYTNIMRLFLIQW